MADDELACPNCRSDEHLAGDRHGKTIHITCSACNLLWHRDASPHARHTSAPA